MFGPGNPPVPGVWRYGTGGVPNIYIVLLRFCLYVCMFHFFSESTYPQVMKRGKYLCYEEAQLTKQDGVWVMHN